MYVCVCVGGETEDEQTRECVCLRGEGVGGDACLVGSGHRRRGGWGGGQHNGSAVATADALCMAMTHRD